MRRSSLLFGFLLFFFFGCSAPGEPAPILPDPGNAGLELPDGFGAFVVANNLGLGRHLAVRDNGDVYIKLRRLENGLGSVALRDTTGDGRADVQAGFSNVTGTGMAIHNGYLYFSSDTVVYRARLEPGSLLPSSQVDLIATVPYAQSHAAKSLAFDGQGNMYVNVGSPSNACQEVSRTKGSPGIDPCPQLEHRAGVWRLSDTQINQHVDRDGYRYATGIRNAVALDWSTTFSSLYVVQHGRDDLHRYWPEYYTEDQNVELPAEEFFQVSEGDDFGWPYCHFDQFQDKKILNPEYGGDGVKTERCEDAKRPLIGFPGHWAPNDLLFYTGDMFPERYKNGAFIAFHGSWNRLNHEQAGYRVVFVPMQNGQPSGDWETFADGFMGPQPVREPGNAQYRPVGLAQGPDGSLYISDSQQGRIWRVLYYPDGVPAIAMIPEPDMQTQWPDSVEVPPELVAGKEVYDAFCLACHQSNGQGVPGMNPPLSGTEWVSGDKTRLINVVLNGLNEPIEINGETYQNVMAAHNFLTDQQIADVLTYIRNSFGNNAGPVTPEEVAAVRNNQ